MRDGIIYSIGLHLVVLVLAIFGMPFLQRDPPPLDQAITVEIVTIADKTTSIEPPSKARPRPKSKPKPAPKPKPVEQRPTPKPPKPQIAAAPPSPAAEPIPLPKPKPKPKPQVKAEPKPKAKPKPETKRTAKPRVKATPRAKPRRERQQDDMLAALRSVDEFEKSAPRTDAPPKKDDKKTPVASLDSRLTISELDALKQQLYRCWNVPLGVRDPASLVVRIRVTMRPDREVLSTEVLDRSGRMGDPYYRAMAESAVRAVRKCSPLRLPAGKFEQWKTFTFRFDPREMVQ